MPLPEFNSAGDLPLGVHKATLDEVVARFGRGTPQRQIVTTRLLRIYELASDTGKLERFIVFGSYVTAKPNPNDVDIILIMGDDFHLSETDKVAEPIFYHLRAQAELGASIFWAAPCGVLLETVDRFIQHWQTTRSHYRRGIVEVIQEQRR